MIDPNTGNLDFTEPEFSIGPHTTRSEFLSRDMAKRSKTVAENEPWHSWQLPYFRSQPNLVVTLRFEGEQLRQVELVDSNPAFGTTWEDYTQEKELARKQSHDALLACCAIHTGRYPWGEVFSVYGPDRPWGGESGINIRYGPPPTNPNDIGRAPSFIYFAILILITAMCIWAVICCLHRSP